MPQEEKATRARASERAVRIAIKAAIAEGLTPSKILVEGAKIAIHFEQDAETGQTEDDPDAPEKW